MPSLTSADAIVQAAKELVDALKGNLPPPSTRPSSAQITALEEIFTPNVENATDVKDNNQPANHTTVPATTEGAGQKRVPVPAPPPQRSPVTTIEEDEITMIPAMPRFSQ